MIMSKQTTVRWLVSILNKEGFAPVLTDEEIQQAIQMEREQIEKSYIKGREDWQKYGFSHYNYEKDMEIPTPRKYYNATYGGNNE
jgi:hypothetical protein